MRMQFHLNHTPAKSIFEIDHSQKIFMIGSCFSENIGNLLKTHRFEVLSNPNGILFNPVSIFNCLNDLVHHNTQDENLILERYGVFLSYLHHSSIHERSKERLVDKINAQNEAAAEFIQNAGYLVITFGTACIYNYTPLNITVANCHKQPASVFEKKMVQPEQVLQLYSGLIEKLQVLNPKLRIIFTVSPVKYLKDGLMENNLSKAILTLSVHQLIQKFSNCFYFPAYELVTDDLRDYRFYKKDMAHPNEQAIEYVWQKFSECFFNSKTLELNDKIHRLNQALQHRSMMDTDNVEAQKLAEFIARQEKEIQKALTF